MYITGETIWAWKTSHRLPPALCARECVIHSSSTHHGLSHTSQVVEWEKITRSIAIPSLYVIQAKTCLCRLTPYNYKAKCMYYIIYKTRIYRYLIWHLYYIALELFFYILFCYNNTLHIYITKYIINSRAILLANTRCLLLLLRIYTQILTHVQSNTTRDRKTCPPIGYTVYLTGYSSWVLIGSLLLEEILYIEPWIFI